MAGMFTDVMSHATIAGRFGFTARATPKGDDWIKNTPELLTWA